MEDHTPHENATPEEQGRTAKGLSRKQFLIGGAAIGVGAAAFGKVSLGQAQTAVPRVQVRAAKKPKVTADLALLNGKIHTMDGSGTVVSEVLIENGRFVQVGNPKDKAEKDKRDKKLKEAVNVDLKGRTVIPGVIDAHNHIVLVGNRPGHHVLAEDVFTIPDLLARYQAKVADVPPGEFITTIGPIAAMQFIDAANPSGRLPTREELDTIPRPVYIQAAQGGSRANSLAAAWFAQVPGGGVTVSAAGVPSGPALQRLREQLLTPETRERSATEALRYYNTLGITTHVDKGAFHSEAPSNGIANENTYTMHNPFLALDREEALPARLRIDFLHQDAATDTALTTLAPRLRNSFPFFGNDWMRTGGIGEFTGGGLEGLKAIARAGWRGEDHTLSLSNATSLVALREQCNAEVPFADRDLRWIISHIPGWNTDLSNRWHALGGGVLVGWGPTRTGTNVGPPYRDVFDHPIHVGYHSDGGDITVINPWLNISTIVTGKNLRGDSILGTQTLTRQETLWLATAANKWFTREDDLGSIEVGNHADLVVLDRDYFTVPDDDIRRLKSVLTVIGGDVAYDAGVLKL
jgi:predicted amidohydrolase YtcJ